MTSQNQTKKVLQTGEKRKEKSDKTQAGDSHSHKKSKVSNDDLENQKHAAQEGYVS